MPDKKKQHYVPRMYIKRFTTNEELYLYNVEKRTYIGNVPYKNICQEDYFYGKNLVNEEMLSNKENEWNNSIEEIIIKKYSEKNISNIKEFSIYQYLRTLGCFEKVNSSINEVLLHTVEFGLENKVLEKEENKKIIDEICKEKADEILAKIEIYTKKIYLN